MMNMFTIEAFINGINILFQYKCACPEVHLTHMELRMLRFVHEVEQNTI